MSCYVYNNSANPTTLTNPQRLPAASRSSFSHRCKSQTAGARYHSLDGIEKECQGAVQNWTAWWLTPLVHNEKSVKPEALTHRKTIGK